MSKIEPTNSASIGRKFPGFEPIEANFIFCPNQFFDLCLSNCSRGTIRLVAYIIRRTLGWLDKNGNPVEQDISVSYSDLVRRANISRRSIPDAIQEAIKHGFIECQTQPRANSDGVNARNGQYRMKWSDGPYQSKLNAFDGFYSGEGYRTTIPNSFFDYIVTTQKRSVTKVVGTVLRHTVGYQNQFGSRRRVAELSYDRIQAYANIKHRPTLSEAIQVAIERGFIRRVQAGCFDTNGGRQSCAAQYAPNWLCKNECRLNGAKTELINTNGAKTESVGRQNPNPRNGAKTELYKKTNSNKTNKQNVVVDLISKLTKEGIKRSVAEQLVTSFTSEVIRNQIEWLDFRNPEHNRAGLLVKAIKGDWSRPVEIETNETKFKNDQELRARHEQQICSIKQERSKLEPVSYTHLTLPTKA